MGRNHLILIRIGPRLFFIANKITILYVLQSILPCHHSFINRIVTIIKNVVDSIHSIILILLVIVIVIRIVTSISKIKNIIITIMKFVEKFIFLALMFMNPHSNPIFSSFLVLLSSFIPQNMLISTVAIANLIVVPISIVIDFSFFNWKLNVKFILYSPIFLINILTSIGIVILRPRSVSIMLLFQMNYGALLRYFFLLCLLLILLGMLSPRLREFRGILWL